MSKINFSAPQDLPEVVITYTLDAPRDLVWRTFTDAEQVPDWWGPRDLTTTVKQMEVKPGGIWNFAQRDVGGHEYVFHGVYHATMAPERLVYTCEFGALPGHVLLETVTFEEHGQQTKLIDKLVYSSVEERDAMLRSGMELGVVDSMERLAELLAKR